MITLSTTGAIGALRNIDQLSARVSGAVANLHAKHRAITTGTLYCKMLRTHGITADTATLVNSLGEDIVVPAVESLSAIPLPATPKNQKLYTSLIQTESNVTQNRVDYLSEARKRVEAFGAILEAAGSVPVLTDISLNQNADLYVQALPEADQLAADMEQTLSALQTIIPVTSEVSDRLFVRGNGQFSRGVIAAMENWNGYNTRDILEHEVATLEERGYNEEVLPKIQEMAEQITAQLRDISSKHEEYTAGAMQLIANLLDDADDEGDVDTGSSNELDDADDVAVPTAERLQLFNAYMSTLENAVKSACAQTVLITEIYS